MKNFLLWLTIYLSIFSSSFVYGENNNTIHFVSQIWEGYTEENCQGYMWKLIRAVYADSHYEIKCSIMPYKRGVEMVKRNMADAWVASYKDEQKFAIYPNWPHDFELTGVVSTKATMKKWRGSQNLTGKKVAFIRGYELDSYIDNKFQKIEVNDLTQAIDMVLAGRSDYAADDSDDISTLLARNPSYSKALEVRPLFRLALYLAFNDSARSRRLIDIWDGKLPELLMNSSIKKIYTDAGKAKDFESYWKDYTAP